MAKLSFTILTEAAYGAAATAAANAAEPPPTLHDVRYLCIYNFPGMLATNL